MSAALQALLAANPFPGLRSFEPDESDRFFGRRQQIDALAARLEQLPLVAVSGASGCGKSSLVKAGLLRELARRHEEEGDTEWRALVMRPGSKPIANLAAALAVALAEAPAGEVTADAAGAAEPAAPHLADEVALSPLERRVGSLHGQLRQGGLALVELVERAQLPKGTRLLVVVDQFEEIFRLRRLSDAEEAGAFVKLLLQSAQAPGSQVSVILTMRSDTLGGCADFAGLPEAVSAGGYLVPRLTRAQRKEAIVGPIELRGCSIAPRLVQRLLSDVSADFDDLPVMQHALSRTWVHWATSGGGRAIDLEDYEAVGGATEALSRHADEAWSDLEPAREPGGTVEHVFRALTERVSGGIELRRPVELRELFAICHDGTPDSSERVRRVVDRYRRADTAFLVPMGDAPLADDAVIDISHESLIRQWASLRRWLDQEAESGRIYGRLATTAALNACGQARRWRQPDLGVALAWRAAERPNAAWARRYAGDFEQAMNFLDDSNEEEIAGVTARRRSQRVWIAAGLVSFVLMAFSVLTWLVHDYAGLASRDRNAEVTLSTFEFFEHLKEATLARRATGASGRDRFDEACKRADALVQDHAWRRTQYERICANASSDISEEVERLQANLLIGEGQVDEVLQRLKDLNGRDAVRVFLNLQRMANLDFSRLHAEPADLLKKTDPKARTQGDPKAAPRDPAGCAAQARVDFVHPIHRAIAATHCAGGPLSADQLKLLATYRHRASANAGWRGFGMAKAEPDGDRFDTDTGTLPTPNASNGEWVYWQVASNASRPADTVDRVAAMLGTTSRTWGVELLLLPLLLAWWLWRKARMRRGEAVREQPSALRLAAAMVVDCMVAGAILLIGVSTADQLVATLNRSGTSVPAVVELAIFLLLAAPAFAYMLLGDALNLRYRRSIGKVVLGLRPVHLAGQARGRIGLGVSARRNAPVLPLYLIAATYGLAAAADADISLLRWTLLVLMVVLTIWQLLLRGRGLGDRWARTRVIDAHSEESRAIDTPPRYLPRRPAIVPAPASAVPDAQPAAA